MADTILMAVAVLAVFGLMVVSWSRFVSRNRKRHRRMMEEKKIIKRALKYNAGKG